MSTLKQSIEFAKSNPNDPRSVHLWEGLTSGALDKQAKTEGIDLTGISNSFVNTPVAETTQDLDGTGFNPTFESNESDSALTSIAKGVGNTPRSAFQLGKDVVSAVSNPVETIKSVGSIVKGAGAKLGETFLEKTDIGNSLLEKANESRIARGLPELQRDESGNLQAEDTEDLEVFNKVAEFYNERYGSLEKLKESAVEDPVGVLGDLATVLTGGGAAIRSAGTAGKLGKVAQAGSTLQKVGSAVEPVSVAGKVGTSIGNATTKVGKTVNELLPNPTRFKQGEVVKALDLTQGDIQGIKKSTGQNVGEYVVSKEVNGKKLLADTPEETLRNVEEMKNNSYQQVRDEVAQVTKTFTDNDIPEIKKSLSSALDELTSGDGIILGLEDEASEIQKLISQDEFTLSDIQRVKEIVDENFSIYKKSGDTASSNKAKGLDKVRKQLKQVIEDEVSANTDGKVDIAQLNNDVAVSYAVKEAIDRGELRGLSRKNVGLTDNIITGSLIGGVSFGGLSPELAVGIFVAKKVAETPTFRIGLAKAIQSLGDSKITEITKQLKGKKLSPENAQLLKNAVESAKQVVETTRIVAPALERTDIKENTK